jgi:tetratricopeptide (TPR) repeat protein
LGWLDVNRKRVVTFAAVAALVAAVIAVLVWRSSERKDEAARALAGVKHNPSDPPTPAVAADYMKVAEQFDGTPAAGQALIRAGTTYFAVGDFQKTQDAFSRFLKDYGDTPWVPQAQYGMAACLEAQGKNPEAIAKYNEFLKGYSADAAADQARFSLARLYEKSSQPAQAIDVLTKMTNGLPPFSPVAATVQERLKAIYAKNPSLLPPPVQRTPPMMTPSMLTNLMVRPPTASNVLTAPPTTVTPAPAPAPAPSAGATGGVPKINLPAPTSGSQPK